MTPRPPHKARGALSNPTGRFESEQRVDLPEYADDWGAPRDDAELPARDDDDDADPYDDDPDELETVVTPERIASIIARNDSPDVPFDQSLNPYRGCEHGCVYCFARPSHAYLGLSPGLDFETRITSKPDAARVLRAELSKKGYRCSVLALGSNTDPYQPVERRLGITRSMLEVLAELEHPVSIVTKSALVTRDLDLLAPMAAKNLAQVFLSITTLDPKLAAILEPRAARPRRRLETMRTLAAAGVPVGVLAAPMIPAINDSELEQILAACHDAGASDAGYVLVRLPHEIKQLFTEWLEAHFPDRKDRVLSLIRGTRDGKLYDATFGTRMRGTGEYADLIGRRFELACRRLGLHHGRPALDTTRFKGGPAAGRQLPLFGE